MTTPIFLLSLPRTGSTWLQSVIASSDEVQSSAEPWILLPLIECVLNGHGFTDYHQSTYRMMQGGLRESRSDYEDILRSSLRAFADKYYGEMGEGYKYFLDKTPRYTLICDQIHDLFPQSKIIILFRNPVEIGRSLATTFGERFNTLFRNEVDFKLGLHNLCELARTGHDNVVTIKYEDAVKDLETTKKTLSEFLEIDLNAIDDISSGRSKTIGWKDNHINGPQSEPRKLSWGEKRAIGGFVREISDLDLATMGYTRADIARHLRRIESRLSLYDLATVVARPAYRMGLVYPFDRLLTRVGLNARRKMAVKRERYGLE